MTERHRCGRCFKHYAELFSHVFILPDGTAFRMDDSCADCIAILGGFVECYLNAKAN